MKLIRGFLARVMGTVRSSRAERDLRAEIDSHLQLHIDDNIKAGMMTFHPSGFTHGPHPKALKKMLK